MIGFTCDDGEPTWCEAICGDGRVVGNEFCDDGNLDGEESCKEDCSRPAIGWVCSGGDVDSKSECSKEETIKNLQYGTSSVLLLTSTS